MNKETALTKARELQQQLARELQAQADAERDLDAAQAEYDAAITAELDALREQLEAEHADIVQRKQDAEQRVKAHKQPISELREEAKEFLPTAAEYLGGDAPKGFTEKAYFAIHVQDKRALFDACMQRFPSVMDVNMSALEAVLRAHAVQDGKEWTLPDMIRHHLGGAAWVYTDYRWSVSNATLKKIDLDE